VGQIVDAAKTDPNKSHNEQIELNALGAQGLPQMTRASTSSSDEVNQKEKEQEKEKH
jgi:hypothetical protein